MANTVTLTFAGEGSDLQSTMREVGSGAQRMSTEVGGSLDRATERFDTMDTRAMGFRDTLTGLQDGAQGVKQAAAGDWGFETLLLLGFGVGDLASGFVNFLLPALKASKLGMLAQAAATNIASGATKAFTLAQRLLSLAFLTSPVGWIVLAIGALIAVIVLIATKTDWFQRLWKNAWGWIKNAAANTWEFLKKIPGWIGSAFGKVAGFIAAPYRAAFNMISRAWNATIGGLSWTVPSWIPGLGGRTISVPNLPTFHSGGIVPGIRGTLQPIMAIAGERVSGLASSGAGAPVAITAGDALIRMVLDMIKAEVGGRGGDPAALGIRIA